MADRKKKPLMAVNHERLFIKEMIENLLHLERFQKFGGKVSTSKIFVLHQL